MAIDPPLRPGGDPEDAACRDDGHALGTRALLDALIAGPPDDVLRLSDMTAGLEQRAFGMLLFLCTLPAFIPIPIGGAVSGPLVILIGAQLLVGRRQPWLPGFIGRRGPHRSAMARFDARISPWLARMERLVKPRMAAMVDGRLANATTGLLLLLLGLLLSLPIPFTNYVFGGLLLLFALALLERDGALMLFAWLAGAAAITVSGVLSGELAAAASHWIARFTG